MLAQVCKLHGSCHAGGIGAIALIALQAASATVMLPISRT
jgi:hypothetical protein